MNVNLQPVAFVKNSRTELIDNHWEAITSQIELAEGVPDEALAGIEQFSHLEIIFLFDKVKPEDVVFAGHPRRSKNWPLTGIFAQRKKDSPNAIGLCTVELLSHDNRTLTVKYLDAIDGSPVLDIKPVFKEFQPKALSANQNG